MFIAISNLSMSKQYSLQRCNRLVIDHPIICIDCRKPSSLALRYMHICILYSICACAYHKIHIYGHFSDCIFARDWKSHFVDH